MDGEAAAPPRLTRSTCPYCGVGCGVLIESRGSRVVGVRGDPDHPANAGQLCTKGATLHLTARPQTAVQVRALHPQVRWTRTAARARCSWDVALATAAERLAQAAREHGPDSIGIYASGQLLTEDYYVLNKLAKALLGTNNIDTNSRLCMSSSVSGYKMTLGADSVPCCYDDVGSADLLFVAGANPAYAHPILYRRIEEARRRNPRQRLIVVDPRRTDTALGADLHLAIEPGTDVALFHGLLHLLIREGAVDRAWIGACTEGFDRLEALVRDYPPQRVAQQCGIACEDLERAASWWSASGAVLSMYCQGLNQSVHGSAKNAALINLHLATRQIGRPGAGPLSLTGQPNAMGGREVGAMATLLSGHRDLADAAHRAEVARLWGVDRIPGAPGRTATELFEAAADGAIKVLWIVCTNPAQSLPDQRLVRAALERAQFVIVQEAYETAATVGYADLLLPAASWAEKDGTVTNSERRISRVRKAVNAPGEARADWAIAVDIAHRIERLLRPGLPTLFPYEAPEQIWIEHRATTAGRDLDISGLSYQRLEDQGPQFWPFPAGADAGSARLYANGRFATPSGRAAFAAIAYAPEAEPSDAAYPMRLNTGRLRDQWHGMTRTGTVSRLFGHTPEPCVQLHPADASALQLRDGDLARVISRRGELVLPVQASPAMRRGQAFIAMHWGSEMVGGADQAGARHGINQLTLAVLDPHSKQPELKNAAVRIEAAHLSWHYLAFARLGSGHWLRAQRALRPHFQRFDYCSCVPMWSGDDDAGAVLLRAASARAAEPALLDEIEGLLGLGGAQTLRYEDPRRAVRRRVRVKDGQLCAVALAGERSMLRSEAWLRELFERGLPADLPIVDLMALRQPMGAANPRGRLVCNCLNVHEQQIRSFLQDYRGNQAELDLSAALGCGTQCGSCRAELRRMVNERALPA